MSTIGRSRICIVGGGSYNWSPTLLRDIASMPDLAGAVVLHDRDAAAADELAQLGQKIMAATDAGFEVIAIDDLSDALRDANVVVVTITTGGLEAMRHDLDIPRQFGIHQSVGDSVGPGGLARGLRNIPVMVEIARTMERVCPNAWLLNLTNPLTTLTRAVTKTTSIKTIGLCHELFGVRRAIMQLLDASIDDIDFRIAGINHLIWLLDLTVRGQDGIGLLRDRLAKGAKIPLKPTGGGYMESFQDRWQVKLALLDAYGYLPAAGDRHVAEFFRYFLTEETGFGATVGVIPTSIEDRYALAAHARARVRAWLDGSEPLLTERSDEPVADIVAALATGGTVRTVVNLPNRGQIANLPPEVVVETMGEVSAVGARGDPVGALPVGVLGTIAPHVLNQELIVEAALTGDRQLALQALLGDSLTREFRTAPRLLDALLTAHADALPNFHA